MSPVTYETQHAALWLIGPDMPGLLRIGSKYVADRGGNIDKDIADKFGEKAVVFMSITASPVDIARMEADREQLKKDTGCGVVFQPMQNPTVPEGYRDELFGFDIVTEDKSGLVVELTEMVERHGMMIVGHTGERRHAPGPRGVYESGQKVVVVVPNDFDQFEFAGDLTKLVHKYNGKIVAPLRAVPGLLWWW